MNRIALEYWWKDKTFLVNVGIEQSHYKILESETSEGFYESELRNKHHGVRWKYNNKSIELFEEGVTINAFPSPDDKYIVTIYDYGSKKFPFPCHCVVYNLDGSIHKVVCTPLMISDGLKYSNRKGEQFIGVNWRLKEDNIVSSLSVADSVSNGRGQWVEDREFNPETGEFGECLHVWLW